MLATTDLQTARRLFEDLDMRDEHGTRYVQHHKARSKSELIALLDGICSACLSGFKPIIHFEAHGSTGIGLEVGELGEIISWSELGDRLREINVAARNGIGVVMAACYGFEQLEAVDILRPCPYNFLIGPVKEVAAGFIDDHMVGVYRKLFESRSLEHAMKLVDGEFFRFQAELFYCTVFVRYLRNNCMGRGAERRVETLLTRAVGEGLASDRNKRRELRRSFKALIRSPEADYYRMGRHFLHGKRTVPFAEVIAVARRDA